jgi:hypothetical protein
MTLALGQHPRLFGQEAAESRRLATSPIGSAPPSVPLELLTLRLLSRRGEVDGRDSGRLDGMLSGVPGVGGAGERGRQGNGVWMRRQQAHANSRSFRSLALPPRNASIACGSAQVSHSVSVITSPIHSAPDQRRIC